MSILNCANGATGRLGRFLAIIALAAIWWSAWTGILLRADYPSNTMGSLHPVQSAICMGFALAALSAIFLGLFGLEFYRLYLWICKGGEVLKEFDNNFYD
jgi:hypothetical protein